MPDKDTGHLDVPSPPPDMEDEDSSDDDSDKESDKEFSNKVAHSPSRVKILQGPTDLDIDVPGLFARLRQPFGALLLEQISKGLVPSHRRVAADSLIRVRFQDNVSLTVILNRVRAIEVV